MRPVIVANYQENWIGSGKKYPLSSLMKYLKSQVEIHIRLGWKPIVITNIANYSPFIGEEFIPFSSPNMICPTGSKMFAAMEFLNGPFSNTQELYWFHDLDVWPCWKFGEDTHQELRLLKTPIAICRYRKSYNGGSVFYKTNAQPMCLDVAKRIIEVKSHKEEPIMNEVWGRNNKNITVLNETFNVGCSGFEGRFDRAHKPICAIHYHPDKRGQRDRFWDLVPEADRIIIERNFK